jgi:hypothetical protein
LGFFFNLIGSGFGFGFGFGLMVGEGDGKIARCGLDDGSKVVHSILFWLEWPVYFFLF